MEFCDVTRFLDYAIETWLLPFLGFLAGAAFPLVLALFVGLDGFTFIGCIFFGLIGGFAGILLHFAVRSWKEKQTS